MFSSQRRQPAKKQQLATITSRLTSVATTTTSTPRTPAVLAASAPRPAVRIATVTRTIQVTVQRPPPPATPLPAPTASPRRSKTPVPPPGKKRKVESGGTREKERHSVGGSSKSRKVDGSTVAVGSPRSRSVVGSVSESSPSEDGSEDDAAAVPVRRRSGSPVVVRDVSAAATLDGRVTCISGEQLVLKNRAAYIDYFFDPAHPANPTMEWAGAEVPTITLEYPGIGATEKFVLLSPKQGGEEYNPIEDVLSVISLILDSFLTPSQSHALFSHMPSTTSFSAFLSAPPSPAAAAPSLLPAEPLMRALRKARAKKDGPAFLAAIERFNVGLRTLKAEGALAENIRGMKGLKGKVWMKIVGQNYERAVGPEVEELGRYEAFSDNVYGELLPRFMSEIFQQTGLGPDSVFVDLGSGVGNCVVQAALATGCEAYGCENMAHASALARSQVAEAEARCRLWGVQPGRMGTVQADFCESAEVGEVLKRADVVLVNNEVFSSALNERLSLLFLDLPSSTQIVSLKAFASSFTLSAHNRDSPLAIIDQGVERRYGRKSVSWKDEGGTYFIARIDRGPLERFTREAEERERERRSRSGE